MSPRLRGYRERFGHDFSWIVDVTDAPTKLSFRDQSFGFSQEVGDDHGALFHGSVTVLDAAMDRSDVALGIIIGNKAPYTYSGPWLRGHAMEFWRIWLDAWIEGRKAEADSILAELRAAKEGHGTITSGIPIPLMVPPRVPWSCSVKLIPGAQPGPCAVHLRTVITREVQ